MNFHKLPYTSTIAEPLAKGLPLLEDEHWEPYHSFLALPVPDNVFDKDPFLLKLYNTHPYRAGVIKVSPYSYYDWHVDSHRGVSINMLLEHAFSHCLFSPTHGDSLTERFEELWYVKHQYYLFNNQVPHCVINFDSPRYLFTIEFDEDRDHLSFDMLLNEMEGEEEWKEIAPS